ncbi:hypothetical protein DVH24_034774 [Malus domestica]|uniref:DNA-directed RNA polymerase subunit n=1 Tax=Malus domestica TaxID=3750 RepID=A0A498J0J4_MALDO|nr:hypothetical protein DVH24_034774 [Malus domestica]
MISSCSVFGFVFTVSKFISWLLCIVQVVRAFVALVGIIFRFMYNDTFEGIVLAYEFNILDKDAKILPGVHPYFTVRLKAKLLLYSPKPDMLVEGKVVKVTQESIHVIILGFSSAVITDRDIREEFQYKSKHGMQLFVSRSHKWHVIKVGTMIRLLVKRYSFAHVVDYQLNDRFDCYCTSSFKKKSVIILVYFHNIDVCSVDEETLYIYGSLLPAHTGSIIWLDKQTEDTSLTDGYFSDLGI